MGLVLFAGKGEAPALKGGAGHLQAVLLGGAQGHPAVKAALQPGVRHLQQSEGHGELARHRFLLGDAQGLAVAVVVGQQLIELLQGLLAGAVGQGQGRQQGHQAGDGVVAPLGPGGVGAGRPWRG